MSETDIPADLRSVFAALRLEGDVAPLLDGWAESTGTFLDADMPFLQEAWIRRKCDELGLKADLCGAFVGSLGLFDDLPALKRLLWYFRSRLTRAGAGAAEKRNEIISWPMPADDLHEHAAMFRAFVYMACTDFMQDFHRRRGVPMSVTRESMIDLDLWMRDSKSRSGKWGCRELLWLSNTLLGRMVRIRRLQFKFETFRSDLHTFRHRSSGRVILLAGDALRFRSDGQFDGCGGLFDKDGAWTSSFGQVETADGAVMRGNPILADGNARTETVDLPCRQWREVLKQNDPVLGIHIPAGEPLDFDACGEAFRCAAELFPRCFPEEPFKAFRCGSWMLDNQFRIFLPETSNIRRFENEVYLFPVENVNDFHNLPRVFGRRIDSIDEAPLDTALQRAIVDWVKAGGNVRRGGCLLFAEDLNWGRQVYHYSGPIVPTG